MFLTKAIDSNHKDPYRKRGDNSRAVWFHQLKRTANNRSAKFKMPITSTTIQQDDSEMNRNNLAPNRLSGETILAIHSNH